MTIFAKSMLKCLFRVGVGLFYVLMQSLTVSAAPLYDLVKNGVSLEEVQQKLKADPNSANMSDSEGETPLIYAIRQMNVDVVRVLLEAGADPDQANKSGLRPLQLADSLARDLPLPKEFERVKQSYIEGGLSPEKAERFLIGCSAAYRAYKAGRERAAPVVAKEIKKLIERKLTEYRESLESSELFRAIRENKVDAVKKLLLAMDASEDGLLNARGRGGQSPIIIALLNFNIEMCEVLLNAGADMSVRDDTGRCALDYVRALDNLFQRHRRLRDAQQIEKAIQSGKLAPDRTDPQGVTLLMKAAAENNYYLCKVLIAHGAKRDARDHNGDLAYDYVGRDAGNPHVEAQLKALLQSK